MTSDPDFAYFTSYFRSPSGELKTNVIHDMPSSRALGEIEASGRIVGASMLMTQRDQITGLMTPMKSLMVYLLKPEQDWTLFQETTAAPIEIGSDLFSTVTTNEIPSKGLTIGEGLESLSTALDLMKPNKGIVDRLKPNQGYCLGVHPTFFQAVEAFNRMGLQTPVRIDLSEGFAPKG